MDFVVIALWQTLEVLLFGAAILTILCINTAIFKSLFGGKEDDKDTENQATEK